MRALWLAPVHYNGGRNIHPAPWVSSLAKSLQDSGDARITILNYQPRLEKDIISFEQDGIEFVFLKTPKPKVDYLTMYKKRIQIMRRYVQERLPEFDIIHVHGSEHQYEAVVHDLDIPVVMSMQGILSEYIKHLKNKSSYTYISWLLSSKYEKNYLSKVHEFMCRTSFDTGFVRKYSPQARVHEHWEMLRPPFFQDLFSRDRNYLLHMGGTNPLKGISQLLQAYNLVRLHSDIKLKLVGNCDPEVIEQIILHHDLRNFTMDDLELMGMLTAEGLAKTFSECYALVHPSLIDNSPNSVCEAQVAGLPVIATNVGGVGSLIDHGHTGLLTDLDPMNIATSINKLIADRDLHEHLSVNSRKEARIRHDPSIIHNSTLEIYQKVIAA